MDERTEKREKRGGAAAPNLGQAPAGAQLHGGGRRRREPCPPDLAEYRRLQRQLAGAERRLAEFCAAIEDFDLHPGSPALADPYPIHCSVGELLPAELLARAQAEAVRTEELTAAVEAARSQVQTRLLQQSRDAAEYQALCRRYLKDAPGQ